MFALDVLFGCLHEKTTSLLFCANGRDAVVEKFFKTRVTTIPLLF
jgi:hypothetical protein